MVRTLQKKFVLSAMLAITILLAVLLGAINAGNISMSQRQNRQLVDMLLREETMMQPPGENKPGGFFGAPVDENFRMSAVYFTVRVNQNVDILKTDTRRIASVSGEEAAEMCRAVLDAGKTEGKIQNFRFKMSMSGRDGDQIYLFLDTTVQLRGILRVLCFSLLAGVVCWLAMLLLVFLISGKAIRPIAENLERQKQFVTDAGHEIKTPLAIILANTEAMELYTGENKWSKNIREQTVRLNGLMQNLLTLARADERRDMSMMEPVSLSKAVADGVQMFAEAMDLKEIVLKKQIDDSIEIRADREQMGRLVSILMENAVKYTIRGGTIAVSLGRQGKTGVLRVENTCEKLPECPPDKLFDRFYRADAARTQENGGYGIGLSAAKTIAELYGGSIRASYRQPDRVIFTVVFK